MNDWPGWAKLIAGLGFPMAVAIWLMVSVSPQISRTAAAMDRHLGESHVQTVLLRAICRNTAKSELAAQFCDYGLPEWSRPQ